jgi:hypothetical protein
LIGSGFYKDVAPTALGRGELKIQKFLDLVWQ